MIKNKKGFTWIWVLIILILIGVGIGLYFWLTNDTSQIINNGSSIPLPPKLPN
jgi:uncharacterized membrane protein